MKYKKSHRDQKCRPYATKAIEAGCNILEIDIQSACGVIVCGHNWRPKLPFLFDCTLADYMKRVPDGVFVQLDVKEICFTERGRKRFAHSIVSAVKPYRNKISFVLSANEGFFRPDTLNETGSLFQAFGVNVERWSVWKTGKEIEVIDLW